MQLSLHADYALRALIYLGIHRGEVASTRQISDAYGISRHHLVRVMQTLGEHGLIDVLPGRTGGVRLAVDPALIRLGDVVRQTEPSLRLVECFERATNTCPIADCCELRGVLHEALESFVGTLNRYTLADLLTSKRHGQLAARFITLTARPTVRGVRL